MRTTGFVILAAVVSLVASVPASANQQDEARYAASYPKLEMKRELEAILDAGFDIDTRYGSPAGWTLLHFAASEGYAENVRFLIERGANPMLEDDRLRKPIDTTHSDEVRAILREAMAPRPGAGALAGPAAPPLAQAATPASPAPASTAVAPAAGAAVPGAAHWDAFGRFKVGDPVLYAHQGGKSWLRGTVKQVGGAPGAVKDKYLVTSADGYDDWWDPDQVTTIERQPYWTSFFVGDWRLSVPMSRVTRVESDQVYRVYSGGVRLPPLRIEGDGTYTWVTTRLGGGEEVVRGRWEPSPAGPGLILRSGERGDDWLIYTANTSQGRETYGTDHVLIGSDNHPAKQGFRL